MSEVILINPPSPFLIDVRCEPPLGILYLAIAIEDIATVKVVDLSGIKLSEYLLQELLGTVLADCKIAGITAVTPQIKYAEEIARWIKSTRKRPSLYSFLKEYNYTNENCN